MTTATAPEDAPRPPSDFARRSLTIRELVPGTILHRFFNVAYAPVHFDKTTSGRFNAPDGNYGVMYLAEDAAGAFAETFLRQPGRTLLTLGEVTRKGHATFALKRTLRFADMSGAGLARHGATAQVPHGGKPYDAPQAWSKAVHAHPDGVDGIAYRARHDDGQMAIALFDRANTALIERGREVDLDAPWFWDLADTYGLGLSP